MSIKLGKLSQSRLETCDARLQDLIWKVATEAPPHLDFQVICGHRDEAAQRAAFKTGASKVLWPNSKHNGSPSMAVDIAPYPIDWTDRFRFARLQGFIECIAWQMGLGERIRFGHDFNRSGKTDDAFVDWPHIELIA